MASTTSKIWTREEILNLINTNNTMVARSVVKLYDYQTADEQATMDTTHRNGCGFNGIDAPLLSSFAVFYTERGFLSPRQTEIARKKLRKYVAQLTRIANGQM